MHCLHDQGLKPKQNSNCMPTGELFLEEKQAMNTCGERTLSLSPIKKVETPVSHLSVAPWQIWCHCYCLFATVNYLTILIGFTAVMKNTAKLPWSSSNSLLHMYPPGAASRSTVDGQRGGSPIPKSRARERRTETGLWWGSGGSRTVTPFFHQPEHEKNPTNPKPQNLRSKLSSQ